jgi:hypothetical protein
MNEKLIDRNITYTLEVDGKLVVIENVPDRIYIETGEQLFSPETVEWLQAMIWKQRKPKQMIRVPL